MGLIEANDGTDLLMFSCCLSDSVGKLATSQILQLSTVVPCTQLVQVLWPDP